MLGFGAHLGTPALRERLVLLGAPAAALPPASAGLGTPAPSFLDLGLLAVLASLLVLLDLALLGVGLGLAVLASLLALLDLALNYYYYY